MKNKKIVIYGLSTETERVLFEWNGKYDIIGLLDGFVSEGEMYGYPILDVRDVVKQENVVIIVVARPGSCKAIVKRIGNLCMKYKVPLYDIRGKNLLAEKKVLYDFKNIKGYTKSDLLNTLEKVDAVSFDLFDTLMVRMVVAFEDVLEILNELLIEKNIVINDFVSKRMMYEKTLSRGHAPRLKSIYKQLLEKEQDVHIEAEELANLEYHTDLRLLISRKEVIDLIRKAKEKGKKVYITSDSYYTKSQIEYILQTNGITMIDDVIVSCEYDTGKADGLFDKLIDLAGTSNIMHIGDDIVADIESSQKHNLKYFHIYSVSDLFDSVGGLGLLDLQATLCDKIKIGMFVSCIFNTPFQFEKDDKRIIVQDAKQIGYLFAAPMILDFLQWFDENIEKNEMKNIWFCARDGYILQKLYVLLCPDRKTTYFLTSRISAIRAGIDSIEDVKYVESMKYSGNLNNNLKTRFGINVDCLKSELVDHNNQGIMQYAKLILKNSREKRKNYKKYIQRLELKEGKIAFFDFVAKGTTQLYLQKIVENPMRGLYFLQLEPEFMKNKGLDIIPFYTEKEKDSSAIFDNYYILETLLTSPDASIDEFDEEGRPVYARETRSKQDIDCVLQAQEGMEAYCEKFLSICPRNKRTINKKLDEKFLMLIHNVVIEDLQFLELTVEDPFFNRMTDIKDIL